MSIMTVSRLAAGCALALGIGAPALAGPHGSQPTIAITPLGTYDAGVFGESAAEIVAPRV